MKTMTMMIRPSKLMLCNPFGYALQSFWQARHEVLIVT